MTNLSMEQGRVAPAMPEAVLECKNVWKVYGMSSADFRKQGSDLSAERLQQLGHTAALRDVSLTAYRGQITVIMGLSGSGKSTILRCMSRLIEPTGGSITYEGKDLLSLSERELIDIRRHKMGMVFQHFALLPNRTALENVIFPLQIQGIPVDERVKRAQEMIKLVGLGGRESRYPHQLSGGQQQRVGIARSLATSPELWFLDEPFSALDPLIRRDMQDEFLRLQRMLNKTIVFVTHDFDEAMRIADKIIIMKDGSVEQEGTPEDIVLTPLTGYVREFTKSVPRMSVLRIHSVQSELTANADTQSRVDASDLLSGALRRSLESDRPLTVVGRDGRPTGELRKDVVMRELDILAVSRH